MIWPRYYVTDMGGFRMESIYPPSPPCVHTRCTSCGVAIYDEDGCGSHYCHSADEGLCETCDDRLHPRRPVNAWRRRVAFPVAEAWDRARWAFARKFGRRVYVE